MSSITRKFQNKMKAAQTQQQLYQLHIELAVAMGMLDKFLPVEQIRELRDKIVAHGQNNPTSTIRESVSSVMQEFFAKEEHNDQ